MVGVSKSYKCTDLIQIQTVNYILSIQGASIAVNLKQAAESNPRGLF